MTIKTTFLGLENYYNFAHQFDNLSSGIEIDCTDIAEDGDTAAVLIRGVDGSSYPALSTYEDGILRYSFTGADLKYPGNIYLQLAIYGPNGKIKHSKVAALHIVSSLPGDEEPPEALKAWLDEATQILENLKKYGSDAEKSAVAAALSEKNAAEAAEAAYDFASAAALSETSAKSQVEAATTAASTAADKATAAAGSASAALSAKNDAETAKASAEAAQTAAETAQNAAEEARDASAASATEAAQSAQTAQTKAQEIADSAEKINAVQKQADRTDRSLDALWKLNEGQTYDFETVEESGMNEPPSGAMYMSPEKVYGKSYQDAEPTPDAPQEIHSVEEIHIKHTDSDGNIVSERTIIPPKPLNGIGEYRDVLDVTNGVWRYVFKEVSGRDLTWVMPSVGKFTFRATVPDFPKQKRGILPAVLTTDYRRVVTQYTMADLVASGDMIVTCHQDANAVFVNDSRFTDRAAFSQAIADKTFIYASGSEETIPIDPDDLDFLRSLALTPASDHIIITDQDGNDIPWLNEYIISLREVVSNG